MAARDDYPYRELQHDANGAVGRYGRMCDEIDRLRDKNANLLARIDDAPKYEALNELVRELTKHADALRSDLIDALDALKNLGVVWPRDTIIAYDEFVKEC